ncbi:MAG: amidohydrolase family protein [Oscillospiraceae bacterium]|nr:amidohydrolase family protein [Oscillospiraceae bacterium]
MIIDIHTHAFPDELAPRAMEKLTDVALPYEPVHNGTLSGLLKNMEDWNFDISVVQPVVTRLSQTKSINEWAVSINSDKIISFGGIYPHTDDYKRDIDYVVSLGLKGLKFHAEYQEFIADDTHMLKIYEYALEKGLILLHHGGYDPAYPPPYRSTPQMFAKISKAMAGGTIIVAHLGGHDQWDAVEEHLAGSDVYLDTSMGFGFFDDELFLRIVEKHGADKILFGSDSPWSNGRDEVEYLRSLPLENDEVESILGSNAARILGLK